MKKIYLVILVIILFISIGTIYLIFNNKQDKVLVSAINTYLEKNKQVINNDTILITSINNLKTEKLLDSSYENNLLKVTYKNNKVEYKILDSYTFKKENYYVVETSNDKVISKSLFYEDSNYKYYLSDSKNYFIKQNNTLIPIYDVVNYKFLEKVELINVIPLEKESKKTIIDNNNTEDNDSEIKEEVENNNKEEENNNSNNGNNNNNQIPDNNNSSTPNTENKLPDNDTESDNKQEENNPGNKVEVTIPDKNDIEKEENIVSNDFVIEDRNGKYCAQAIDEFWRDSTGIYYFTCQRSKNIYIVFKNGEEYLLKEALSSGKVTINQLYEKGLRPLKKNIQYEER